MDRGRTDALIASLRLERMDFWPWVYGHSRFGRATVILDGGRRFGSAERLRVLLQTLKDAARVAFRAHSPREKHHSMADGRVA